MEHRQREQLGLPERTLPEGGPLNPLFEQAGGRQLWRLVLTFASEQSDQRLDLVEGALSTWTRSAALIDSSDTAHAEEPFLGRSALRLVLHNLEHPREAVCDLLARFAAIPLPLKEATFTLLAPRAGTDRLLHVRAPDAPPEQGPFPDEPSYRRVVFDLSSPSPASEYESQVQGAYRTRLGDLVVEERLTPLFVPGLRLGYGVLRAQFLEPDSRTFEVRDAVLAQLAKQVSASLQPFEHGGKPGQLDRLELEGRRGFGFGLLSNDLIHRYSDRFYRYREAEVVRALSDVVREKGLSPVVTWQRFGEPLFSELRTVQTHVFQLWER